MASTEEWNQLGWGQEIITFYTTFYFLQFYKAMYFVSEHLIIQLEIKEKLT